MRVLALVTESFGGHGGIALYLRDLLTAISLDNDCKEIVLLSRHKNNGADEIPQKVKSMSRASESKLHLITALLNLLIRDRNFELIVCGHINLLPLAYLAHVFTGAPILLMIYGIDVWSPTGGGFTKWLVKRKIQVVSISKHTRRLFSQWSGVAENRVEILPNAIHLNKYAMGPKNEGLLDRYSIHGKRVVMTLGRLNAGERYKGMDEILNVLPELIETNPDLVYMILGDGDDKARLQARVTNEHLSEFVIFTGRIAESEKAEHFRLADAFAMPGRGEGFGFVFLEAMACGIPVVASKLDGSREAVREGSLGIMVDPDNAEDLRKGLAQALNEPKRIPDGLEYFAFENFVSRLAGISRQLVAGAE